MTHPMPEINSLLKQLRLLHIINYFPQRNRESIEKKLSFSEFLSLVLQDEILGRENKKLQARLRRACIRGDKTFENFDFDFNSKINRAQIQDLMECQFVSENAPVLIV